jgi:OFA family oxalate/formate antiporter-like MFS transporter
MACCFVLGILAGGFLNNKLKPKIIVLIGGGLLTLGVLSASFVNSAMPQLIWPTYGIVAGFGVGMVYNTVLACAQKWFPHKRGLAVGVSVCSFGLSTAIFAPLAVVLVDKLGSVPATFRVLAAMFAIATVALFAFISEPDTATVAAQTKGSAVGDDMTLKQAMKTVNFWLIFGLMLLANAPYLISFPAFNSLALSRGLSEGTATLMITLTGFASAAGRILWPLTVKKLSSRGSAIIGSVVTAIAALLLLWAQGWALIVLMLIITFFFGGFSGINPLLTSDYFGIKNVASVYGAIMVGYMLCSLLFPILLGGAADAVRYPVLAAVALLAGIFMLLLRRKKAL